MHRHMAQVQTVRHNHCRLLFKSWCLREPVIGDSIWDWGGPLWPPHRLSQGNMAVMAGSWGWWLARGAGVYSASWSASRDSCGPLLGCDYDCSSCHATFYTVLSLSWCSWENYHLSIYLPIYLSIYLSIYLPTYLPTYLSDPAGELLKVKMGAFLCLCLSWLSAKKPAWSRRSKHVSYTNNELMHSKVLVGDNDL